MLNLRLRTVIYKVYFVNLDDLFSPHSLSGFSYSSHNLLKIFILHSFIHDLICIVYISLNHSWTLKYIVSIDFHWTRIFVFFYIRSCPKNSHISPFSVLIYRVHANRKTWAFVRVFTVSFSIDSLNECPPLRPGKK